MIDVADWFRSHDTIVGFPNSCRANPGLLHPLVAHDCKAYVRAQDRFREINVERLRVSPDVAHMLMKCDVADHPAALEIGFDIVCDPSLPPNSIVAS